MIGDTRDTLLSTCSRGVGHSRLVTINPASGVVTPGAFSSLEITMLEQNEGGLTRPQDQEKDWSTFQPPWGPIGEPVFLRSYSQTLNRREIHEARVRNRDHNLEAHGIEQQIPTEIKETYFQTVTRAVDGNLGLVDPQHIEPHEREKLIELLMTMAALPAGRHLNASGMKGKQFLFNCHGAGWDPQRPWLHFSFLFDELMQGGGVGSNYSNRYLSQLPRLKKFIDLRIICRLDHPDRAEFQTLLSDSAYASGPYLKVLDSREGWVEAAEILLKHAWGFNGDEDTFTIDVSDVREKGAPLISSGGISCGPGPLVTMLKDMVDVLNRCIVLGQISSLDAMDLDHSLSACVIAGGKRRSSRMAVKNWKDSDIFDFIAAKEQDGKHWTTNLSVETDDDFEKAFFDPMNPDHQWAQLVAAGTWSRARTNGEPAFWNRSAAARGEREPEKMYCPNPCGEIGLHMWENCNLGHVNLQHFASKSRRKMLEAFRLMTRWLIRATFGDIPRQEQREVVNQNRRIGVGFFGFHGWLVLNGIKFSECWKDEWVIAMLKTMRETVDYEAKKYAREIGIPEPVKTTTLAPTGTVSLLPGVTSGIQPIYARHFKRRVRYADTDSELAKKKAMGYPVEQAINERNTEVVTYYCEDPLVEAVKARDFDASVIEAQDEIDLADYLEVQAMIQEVYANNSISFTINVPESKMPQTEQLVDAVMERHHRLKGTTIFPDKSRQQSPYERLTEAEFEAWTGHKEITQIEEDCKTGCPV
jgi:ribonucleoside-triphosphate reductase